MTNLYWRCLECLSTGTTTGTESGQDVKHQEATKHATTSHKTAWNDCDGCRHLLVDHETGGPCTIRECQCTAEETA